MEKQAPRVFRFEYPKMPRAMAISRECFTRTSSITGGTLSREYGMLPDGTEVVTWTHS